MSTALKNRSALQTTPSCVLYSSPPQLMRIAPFSASSSSSHASFEVGESTRRVVSLRRRAEVLQRLPVPVRVRDKLSGQYGKEHFDRAARFLVAKRLEILDDLVQALAMDKLHGVVVDASFLTSAEDRHDVRVVEPGRRLRFTPEAFPLLFADEGMRRKDLES